MAVRVGDKFRVTRPFGNGKPREETWTVESMARDETVTLAASHIVRDTGHAATHKKREKLALVILMTWAHNGQRIAKGAGDKLERLV